jgi:hypothetical protein
MVRLKTALRWKIPAAQRERIQMVLLRARAEMTQPSIAAVMGVSLSTDNRAHLAYDQGDQGGIKALKPRRTQAREHDLGRGKGLAGSLCEDGERQRDVEHP